MLVWAPTDTTFSRTIFSSVYGDFWLVSVRLSFNGHYPFPYYFFQSDFFSDQFTIISASLVRVWASTDTTLSRTIFRDQLTVIFGSLVGVWAPTDTTLSRTIFFRAIFFSDQFTIISALLVRVWASTDTTLSRTIFHDQLTVIFGSLVRVWAPTDTTFFRTIFRAVFEWMSEWMSVFSCWFSTRRINWAHDAVVDRTDAAGVDGGGQRECALLRAHQIGPVPLHRLHADVDAQSGGSRSAEGRPVAAADVHAVDPVRMFQSVAVLPLLRLRAHVHRESPDSYRPVSTPLPGRSLPLPTCSPGFSIFFLNY